jgi:proteic killer suppression protein
MIASFGDAATEDFFHGRDTKRARSIPQDIVGVAHRKLDYVDAATSLEDLKVPPGNRLELLKGDRAGRYSIRINQQWRVVFRWENGAAHEVSIVDYH